MAKFLILNHPPSPVPKGSQVSECMNHFYALDREGRARVLPVAGQKGYATLVDVDSHEALSAILEGNAMSRIEQYRVIALAPLREPKGR